MTNSSQGELFHAFSSAPIRQVWDEEPEGEPLTDERFQPLTCPKCKKKTEHEVSVKGRGHIPEVGSAFVVWWATMECLTCGHREYDRLEESDDDE